MTINTFIFILLVVLESPGGEIQVHAAQLDTKEQCVLTSNIIENDFALQREAMENIEDEDYWWDKPSRNELILSGCLITPVDKEWKGESA